MPADTAEVVIENQSAKTVQFTEHSRWRDFRISVARVDPSLTLWTYTAHSGLMVAAENTLNLADARMLGPVSIRYRGYTLPRESLGRLRGEWWVIQSADSAPFHFPLPLDTGLPEFEQPQWTVLTSTYGKIIPDGQGTNTTGDAPEHGPEPAWANSRDASLAQGRVYRRLPIMLRDPETLELVTDTRVTMGFNPAGIHGLPKMADGRTFDPRAFGVKLKTSHEWSTRPGFHAARGTILEFAYYELMEAVALHGWLSDRPGVPWDREIRASGRVARNWCHLVQAARELDVVDGVTHVIIDALSKWAAYYREPTWRPDLGITWPNRLEPFHVAKGIRKPDRDTPYYSLALWEWAQWCNAAVRCRFAGFDVGRRLEDVLDFQSEFGELFPYEFEIASKEGVVWNLDTMREKNAGKKQRLHELYLFDWCRHELGRPTVLPLDAPRYDALATVNHAGFRLRPLRRPEPTPPAADRKAELQAIGRRLLEIAEGI